VDDGFDLVVSRVTRGNPSRAKSFGRPAQEFVTSGAGGRLPSITLLGRQSSHVRRAGFKRHSHAIAKRRQPDLIRVRIRSAQSVIQIADNHSSASARSPFQRIYRPQKRHAIRPARDGKQDVHLTPVDNRPRGGDFKLKRM
jgi:hypothetical protein